MGKGPTVRTAKALHRIKPGDFVLVRGETVALAPESIANGRAQPRPDWDEAEPECRVGEQISVEMFDGIGGRELQALADGPIMDPIRIYLPAGKISEADYRARLAEQMRGMGRGGEEREE